MNTRLSPMTLVFSAVWAAIFIAITYYGQRAGYPLWLAAGSAYILLAVVIGSINYTLHARQLRAEGKEPPRYLWFLFSPAGGLKLKGNAPRSTHILAGIISVVVGAFFLFCGVALALDAEWTRISHPIVVGILCLVPAGIGIALLYFSWRCFTFGKRSAHVA